MQAFSSQHVYCFSLVYCSLSKPHRVPRKHPRTVREKCHHRRPQPCRQSRRHALTTQPCSFLHLPLRQRSQRVNDLHCCRKLRVLALEPPRIPQHLMNENMSKRRSRVSIQIRGTVWKNKLELQPPLPLWQLTKKSVSKRWPRVSDQLRWTVWRNALGLLPPLSPPLWTSKNQIKSHPHLLAQFRGTMWKNALNMWLLPP